MTNFAELKNDITRLISKYAFWASDYYATNGFSVTNLSLRATKDIKISDSFSLPLFARLVANPASQGLYFVAGFTLNAF